MSLEIVMNLINLETSLTLLCDKSLWEVVDVGPISSGWFGARELVFPFEGVNEVERVASFVSPSSFREKRIVVDELVVASEWVGVPVQFFGELLAKGLSDEELEFANRHERVFQILAHCNYLCLSLLSSWV